MSGQRFVAGLAVVAMGAGAVATEVQVSPKASDTERFASREVARYVYVRTGELPTKGSKPTIIIARKDHAAKWLNKAPGIKALKPQQYVLKALNRKTLLIVGGDDSGTLYGAYRFAEKLGVRFYLHGDVIPDGRIKLDLTKMGEVGKPLFDIRGINPFHDFSEGPDWWNRDDYITYIGQLAKMRMNFIGLHCYPEGGVGPEALVRIGLKGDKEAYPAVWANTVRPTGWGYAPMKTGEFVAGASQLFPKDDFGPDVMDGMMPMSTQAHASELFDRTESMIGDAFRFAKRVGVRTCVGTETPLTIPAAVKERMKAAGLDPADPLAVQQVYEGTFANLARKMPLDYYWLWTPEDWTWGGNKPEQYQATLRDINSALSALKAIGNPFGLATSGWVLGPTQDRAALDRDLPKSVPVSAINQEVGHAPVEPAFANVKGRPKWAIPWMENDPELTSPQPWAGRMRADAVDALRYGCTGLLGIHWRTKALAMNVSALAQAGWDQSWAPPFDPAAKKPPYRGHTAQFTEPVANAEVEKVYQSVRYDMPDYTFKLKNGLYKVTLMFNEPFYMEAGKRQFGVKLQGQTVLSGIDLFARFGKNHARDYLFEGVRVSNGTLKIEFLKEIEYPAIAGIIIEGLGKTVRINCGGPALPGWEGDLDVGEGHPRKRTMPIAAFYEDFALAGFGKGVAKEAGHILASVDGDAFPKPAFWGSGPGDVKVEKLTREELALRYGFVRKLEALRSRVVGKGNLERFDYWLNTYRLMEAMAEAGSLRATLNEQVEAIKKGNGALASAVQTRIELSRAWEKVIRLAIATVDTPGELGTIDNLERHSRKTDALVTGHDEFLRQALGKELPKETALSMGYVGPARIILPTVRTSAAPGEKLKIKVILLPAKPGDGVYGKLLWRPIGTLKYKTVELKHEGRAVYSAELPAIKDGILGVEYCVMATLGDKTLRYPPTAPNPNLTVIRTH